MRHKTLFALFASLVVIIQFSCSKDASPGDNGGDTTRFTPLDSFQLTGLKWWYVGDSLSRGYPSDVDSVECDNSGRISTVTAQRYFGGRDSMRYSFDYTATGKLSHLRKTWLSATTSTYYDYNFDYSADDKPVSLTVNQAPIYAYYPLKEYFTYDSKGHIQTAKRYDQRGLLLDSAVYYRNAAGSALDSIMVLTYWYDDLWNARSTLRSSFIFDNSISVPTGALPTINIMDNSGYILTIPARNNNWDLSVGGYLGGEVMYVFQFYNPDIFLFKNCRYVGVYSDQPTITRQFNWYTSFYDDGLLKALKYDLDNVEGSSGSIELMFSRK